MQISFFGRLADTLGARHIGDAPDGLADGEALRDWLCTTYPDMAELLHHVGTRLMLDEEISDWASPLVGIGDIAVIPVVSGG